MFSVKYDYVRFMSFDEYEKFRTNPDNKLTNLHLAVLDRDFEEVNNLLSSDANCDVNSQDINGNSPFHLLFRALFDEAKVPSNVGYDSIAELIENTTSRFLTSGSDTHLKNDLGLRPIDLSFEFYERSGFRAHEPAFRIVADRLLELTYRSDALLAPLDAFDAINYAIHLRNLPMQRHIFKCFYCNLETNVLYALAVRLLVTFHSPETEEENLYPIGSFLFDFDDADRARVTKWVELKTIAHKYIEFNLSKLAPVALASDEATRVLCAVLEQMRRFPVAFELNSPLFKVFGVPYCDLLAEDGGSSASARYRFLLIVETALRLRFRGLTGNGYASLAFKAWMRFFHSSDGWIGRTKSEIEAVGRHYRVFLAFCTHIRMPSEIETELYSPRVICEDLERRLGEQFKDYLDAFESFFPKDFVEELKTIVPTWRPKFPSLKAICRRKVRQIVVNAIAFQDDVEFIERINRLEVPNEVKLYLRFIE